MTRHETLLHVARRSIEANLGGPPVEHPPESPWLDEPRAVFVTLKKHGELRGCVGQLQARQSLFHAVKDAAEAAAFRDHRFPPLDAAELPELHLEISVLTPLEPVDVHSEEEALRALRPGVDGVVLSFGSRSAVFIPEMWKQLPEPRDFLRQLRRKGGLPLETWPKELTVQRFTAELVAEPEGRP